MWKTTGMSGYPCYLISMNCHGRYKTFQKSYDSAGHARIFAPFHRRLWNACRFSYKDRYCALFAKQKDSLFDTPSALGKNFKRASAWCCPCQWLKRAWRWLLKRSPYTRCQATDFAAPRDRVADWFYPLVECSVGLWTWRWLVVSMTRQQFIWALL